MKQVYIPNQFKIFPNNDQPLISVVVATYNGEKFIVQQLESILNQTYKNIEVIVIDDCSTDNTVEILKQYENTYNNLKVYYNNNNLGYIKNFEKGLSLCRGELVAPSDHDDVWHLNKLEYLYHKLEGNPIVYCDSVLMNDKNELSNIKLSDIKKLTNFTNCKNYAIGNSAAGHAMLIRKEIIHQCFPFPDMIPHDYWIGFVATFYGCVKFIDEVLVQYRQHSSNVFGVGKKKGGINSNLKKKNTLFIERQNAKRRVEILFNKCPLQLYEEKTFYKKLHYYYQNESLLNKIKTFTLFLKYRNEIMIFKRRNQLRKILFCLKMLYKIV